MSKRKIEHAWGRSDRAFVVDENTKRGWVLVKECRTGSHNRPHFELEFVKDGDDEQGYMEIQS